MVKAVLQKNKDQVKPVDARTGLTVGNRLPCKWRNEEQRMKHKTIINRFLDLCEIIDIKINIEGPSLFYVHYVDCKHNYLDD
jgi:hypothetical protein